MKRRIYPIFLPHAGCPFRCIYCNQKVVVHCEEGEDVETSFERQLAAFPERPPDGGPAELAFYGGAFTAIPFDLLGKMLETAASGVAQGRFQGIRFSTRPDCMGPEVCDFLSNYPIRTVELGVQSLSDEVLAASRRGYDRLIVERAARAVRERGWELGVQLMLGLPGDSRERFLESAARAIALAPAFVRLYPTLVLRGSVLAAIHARGQYRPLDLEEAVSWCASAYESFRRAGIRVIRMGLQSDPELEKPGAVLAGPHHPAFGHLVRSLWWRLRIDAAIEGLARPKGEDGFLALRFPSRSVSEILGAGRSNIAHWKDRWKLREVLLEPDSAMPSDLFDARFDHSSSS